MKTLTDRKIAEQEKVTYDTQRLAEETRKDLEQARALATTQSRVVDAERGVTIAEFNARATVKKAEGDATSKTINAKADAEVLSTVGIAEGRKIAAVGEAEARVIELKTAAVGQGNFAVIEVGKALAASGFKLVPDIVTGGGEQGAAGGIMNALIAGMLKDNLATRHNRGEVDKGPTV
jgi:hypothetical protein